MTTNIRILIVDDEPQITRVLRHSLSAHRFDVRTAADGVSALDTFGDWHPNLLITDLQMPEMDGIELCRSIRKVSNIPIIVLSVRGDERSKIKALDVGADDYVTKPFGMNELLARIRAALRRAPNEEDLASGILEDGDFRIDQNQRRVAVRSKPVHVTPKEFDLLVYLFRNRGKVITHRSLLSAVWGAEHSQQPEYLRVFLGNLRKKIEVDPSIPRYILTEPWIGYRFNTTP
jgi:two-component system KDP operon response regulator KdpE